MKANLCSTVCLLFITVLLGESAAAEKPAAKESAKNPAAILTTEGKVEVSRVGTTDWISAQTNLVLQIGDRVRTGPRSRATIRMSNLTVLRVNELTTLVIRQPQQLTSQSMLDLQGGSVYFFSREKPTETQFRTPLASGAIRGTEFHLAVGEADRTVVTLLDGEVELSNPQGQVNLSNNEQGIVEAGAAPRKTAVIDAINIIQWCLYYPGVMDVDELALTAEQKQILANSLSAYHSGELLQALATYPDGRQPSSDSEKIYRAAVLLAVGQVEQTEALLNSLPAATPAAEALREVIAAVKFQTWNRGAQAALATEHLAESYYFQSLSKLKEALNAAKAATAKSPNFGFAWVRVAELEFSFGRIGDARAALEKGLQLSPRNPQALALKGFLLSAQNRIGEALNYFDQAVAVDGGLGNAWLGRGLCQIRLGHAEEGRNDLQTAATLEPNRAILRSYLGKAFSQTKDQLRSERELNRAKKLDPNDPTEWLYSALLNQQRNRINEAIEDMEKSQELNDNRRVFRSRLLLDQDQAVRSANLASIYKDAGMFDVSVREASRAVNYDYGNYSAHLFLANSYDALRDPKRINLRYEAPWLSELLVANLLAPAGAGNLSQNVSQQEYSRLFEGDHLGLSSRTEYFSSGDWVQYGSQYGNLNNFSYALDANYRSENGQRPNNGLEQTTWSAKVKQQITPQDSLYFQVLRFETESGDVAQYYQQSLVITNQPSPALGFRFKEIQEPDIFAGYHHEWNPGVHTLFLAGYFDDSLSYTDSAPKLLFIKQRNGVVTGVENPSLFAVDYDRHFTAFTAELQQIWQTPKQTLIVGGRYQAGWADTSSLLTRQLTGVVTNQNTDTDLSRFSAYAYEQLQLLDPLRLTAGISYDRLEYPRNIDTSPITDAQTSTDQVSPKLGLLWTPDEQTRIRGIYTRSLGGVFFDNSIRLEPTQIAGFNQAFRSVAPESAVGLVPGTEFQTYGLGLDRTFKSGTYFGIEGEILQSDALRTVGAFTNQFNIPIPNSASSTRQTLDFQEKSLLLTINQLIGTEWSLGLRYKVSEAELDGKFIDVPANVPGASGINQDVSAVLHQLNLYAIYNHPSGFFGQVQAVWSAQSNHGYTPDLPGDDFWQFNALVGYRFWRRTAEIDLGLLNISDQNYRLNPLNLYSELPRERTLYVSLKFYF